jgi:hypothetical protein
MNVWDSDELYEKAKLFLEKANAAELEGKTDFAFYSSLALELLSRAALSKVSPVLNADPQQETNIYYALGIEIIGQPRSIPVHSVHARLEKLVKGYEKSHKDFSDYFAILRNQELHTAQLAFENLKQSEWLPKFYEVVQILCEHMERSLQDLLGKETAATALKMIAALNKEMESKIKSSIAAHAKVFGEKTPEERQRLTVAANASVVRLELGTVAAKCPSCSSPALLSGELIRSSQPKFEEGHLVVEEVYLSEELECVACQLRLAGVQEIHWAGLEPQFVDYRYTDLHEYFQPEHEDPYMNM